MVYQEGEGALYSSRYYGQSILVSTSDAIAHEGDGAAGHGGGSSTGHGTVLKLTSAAYFISKLVTNSFHTPMGASLVQFLGCARKLPANMPLLQL